MLNPCFSRHVANIQDFWGSGNLEPQSRWVSTALYRATSCYELKEYIEIAWQLFVIYLIWFYMYVHVMNFYDSQVRKAARTRQSFFPTWTSEVAARRAIWIKSFSKLGAKDHWWWSKFGCVCGVSSVTYLQIHRIFETPVTVMPLRVPLCVCWLDKVFSYGEGEWTYIDVAQRHFTIFLWSCTLPFWSCTPMLTSTLKFWYHQGHKCPSLDLEFQCQAVDLHGQTSLADKRSPSWAVRASATLELNA